MSEAAQIDKSEWPEGPWHKELDRIEFEHLGLPCLMVRHPSAGHWCGYVAVPPGHPAHGVGYDDVPASAHGGLTYAAACSGGVCHIPKPGESDDVWWLGFDCAHCGDVSPGYMRFGSLDGEYRNQVYVEAETRRLAKQLKELTP